MGEELIPQRGNYKKLLSYQKTDVIFQLTYYFCQTYLQRGDRTVDQIAGAVGYENMGYFHRIFKEAFGASPRTYRLQIR